MGKPSEEVMEGRARCDECLFWVEANKYDGKQYGYCRFYAPHWTENTVDEMDHAWTPADHWCGDYFHKPVQP